MSNTLHVIGVGPGPSSLLTLEGISIIRDSNYIVLARGAGETTGQAYQIAEPFFKPRAKIIELNFPLLPEREDPQFLEQRWKDLSIQINALLEITDVTFLTIGGPAFYSAYSYIRPLIKKSFNVKIVPGVNTFSYLASKFNISLTQGDSNFAVIASNDQPKKVRHLVEYSDCCVIQKICLNPRLLKNIIRELNLEENFVLCSNIGFSDEFYSTNLDDIVDDLPPFTTILIKKGYNFKKNLML